MMFDCHVLYSPSKPPRKTPINRYRPVTDDKHCLFHNHGMFTTISCPNRVEIQSVGPCPYQDHKEGFARSHRKIVRCLSKLVFHPNQTGHTVTPVSLSIFTPTNVSSMKWSVNFSDNWNNLSTFVFRPLSLPNVFETKSQVSQHIWWSVSKKDLFVVSRSNSKKKNVNAKTITSRKFLLWIRLWLVLKSILKPRCVISWKTLFSGASWNGVLLCIRLSSINSTLIPSLSMLSHPLRLLRRDRGARDEMFLVLAVHKLLMVKSIMFVSFFSLSCLGIWIWWWHSLIFEHQRLSKFVSGMITMFILFFNVVGINSSSRRKQMKRFMDVTQEQHWERELDHTVPPSS